MAVIDAMFTGRQAVMSAFERHENPVFSVWQGKDLIFSHNNDDFDSAVQLLDSNIEAMEQQQNRSVFKVKLHPKTAADYITDKTPVCGSFTFRAVEWNPGGMRPDGSIIQHPANTFSGAIMEKLNKIAENQAAIDSRLQALEDETDDDDDDNRGVLGQVENVTDMVNKLCSNPVIAGLISRFLTPSSGAAPSALALAGVEDENKKLETALAVLKNADPQLADDLTKLAIIAQQNPGQFNLLISTLRGMVK